MRDVHRAKCGDQKNGNGHPAARCPANEEGLDGVPCVRGGPYRFAGGGQGGLSGDFGEGWIPVPLPPPACLNQWSEFSGRTLW
jgi:hypothetical protein